MTQEIPGKQVLVKIFDCEKTNSFRKEFFKSAHSVFEEHKLDKLRETKRFDKKNAECFLIRVLNYLSVLTLD